MSQMLGIFAEFERTIIQERVRAGLQRAKCEGKRLGRPPSGRHERAEDGGQVRGKPKHRTGHRPPFRRRRARKRRRRGVGE